MSEDDDTVGWWQ